MTSHLHQLLSELFPGEDVELPLETERPPSEEHFSDDELLARMFASKSGDKIRALWNGEITRYNDDDSRADEALCFYLAWWTNHDTAQMDRLFRRSALYRQKWERKDYREATIGKAQALVTGGYSGRSSNGYAGFSMNGLGLAPDADVPRFPATDSGNGELFAYLYKGKVAYDHARGRWLEWAGHWWQEDDIDRVYQLAKDAARFRYHAAWGITDTEQRKHEAKFALSSEKRSNVEAMLVMARTEPEIASDGKGWDTNPWLLGVENGVLELYAPGQISPVRFRAGKPEDRVTRHAPVAYDPGATCPAFDAFIRRIQPDEEIRTYLQRRAGYMLTGSVAEQDLDIWYGPGANGKSTLGGAIRDVLGPDYAAQAAPDLLLSHQWDRHPTELADLEGLRAVFSSEIQDGRRLAEGLVKQLTGGERIRARRMRQDFREFDSTAKFTLLTNHKPIVRGTDYAMWRRLRLVPFSVIIPEHERDPYLADRLAKERSGILNWMLDGLFQYFVVGTNPPAAVLAATEEYREESDVVGRFVAERCMLGDGLSVMASELYRAYKTWAEDQGMSSREIMSATAFGRLMGERFHRQRNKQGLFYDGIMIG